jgi:hypothetical protein
MLLATLAKSESADFSDFRETGRDGYADRIRFEAQAVALARYGAAHGHEEMASRLLAKAKQKLEKERRRPFAVELQNEFLWVLEWRATLALADARETRRTLAKRLREIVANCPKAFDIERSAKLAGQLEQLAAEDDAHSSPSEEELRRLSPKERAKELVFQLRDQTAGPEPTDWYHPALWPFTPMRENGFTKAVVAAGWSAVPALLEALSDERPSRSVIVTIRHGGQARVREIREIAHDALEEIAGVDFFSVSSGGWEPMQKAAREWWSSVQKVGELEWLRQQLKGGGKGSPDYLDMLKRRFPRQAVKIAASTAAECRDPQVRAWLVERLYDIDSAETRDFLLKELKEGPTLGNRVAAAFVLRRKKDESAVAAMIGEGRRIAKWETPARGSGTVFFLPSRVMDSDPNSQNLLLAFLLSSDSVAAIKSVQEAWPSLNVEMRMTVLRLLSFSPEPDWSEPPGPRTKEAIQGLLVAGLRDDTPIGGSFNGLEKARIAEMVADEMASLWPELYRFTSHPKDETERAAQLKAIREANGIISGNP